MPTFDREPCPVEVLVIKRVYAARSPLSGIVRIFDDTDTKRDKPHAGEWVVPWCCFSAWLTKEALSMRKFNDQHDHGAIALNMALRKARK